MRTTLTLALVAALFLFGCGARTVASAGYSFPMPDQDAAQNAFLEAVREYYATRTDGKLSDPGISGAHVKLIYRYTKITNGQHTEEIRFDGQAERSVRTNSGPNQTQPATYSVGVWHQREGADPEIPAVRNEILAGMKKRLGAESGIP